MRDQDLADSPLASHRDLPSNHIDSVEDFVREAAEEYAGPLPASLPELREVCVALAVEGLRVAEIAGREVEFTESSASNAVVRGLQILAEMPNWRIAGPAICYLRLCGHEGRSFAAIGKQFGVKRATVNFLYRTIQKKHPNLRSRGDKPEIREQCRLRRIGKRKPSFECKTKSIWTKPLPKALLLLPFSPMAS